MAAKTMADPAPGGGVLATHLGVGLTMGTKQIDSGLTFSAGRMR